MALSLNPLPNSSSQQWIHCDYNVVSLSLHYPTIPCQTFITIYQSLIYAAPVIQLHETKSPSLYENILQHNARSTLCYFAIWGVQPGHKWFVILHRVAGTKGVWLWSCVTPGGPPLLHSGLSNCWPKGNAHPELFDGMHAIPKHTGHKYKWQH